MGAGKLALMIGIPVLLLGGGAAVAFAAQGKPEALPPAGGGGPDPNAFALNAIKTADPGQLDVAARTLAGSGAVSHAGALNSVRQFIQESVTQLPADVSGMIVAAIKTGDGTMCAMTAREIKNRYPVAAVNLETTGKVIAWLQSGAPGAAPLLSAGDLAQQAAQAASNEVSSDPNGKALDAIASGDATTVAKCAGLLSQAGAARQADALSKISTFLAEAKLELPADVYGMMQSALLTRDVNTVIRTSGAIAPKYQVASANLADVAAVMKWLKEGASGVMPSFDQAFETMATSTIPATSAIPPVEVPPPSTTATALDAALIDRIAKTLASGNIPAMKALAAELELKGLTLQAQNLRLVIDQLEAQQQAAVATTGSPAPAPVVIAPTAAPPTVTPAQAPAVLATPTPVQPTVDPGAALAGRIQLHLNSTEKGSEDKPFITEFQVKEGITPSNGTYGVTTAKVLGDKYGFVPPNPFYWGDTSLKGVAQYNSWKNDIAGYKRWLNEKKAGDSARASEWDARIKAMPKGA
jgi:hypothetical protein